MKVLNISIDYDYSNVYPCLQKALIDNGVDSCFFVPTSFNYHTNSTDCKIIYAPSFRKADRLFYFRKQNKIYKKIKPVIEAIKPDLLHSHFVFSSGYLCLKAKKEYGIPYIVAVRNTDVNIFFKYCFWLRLLGLTILRDASAVVFISEAYKQKVVNEYIPPKYKQEIQSKTYVIPNGIESVWLGKDPRTKNLNGKGIRIVYVGSIDKNKNLLATLDACKILIKKGYKTSYTVIGRIEKKDIYRKIIQQPFVTYFPPKSPDELIDIFKTQDIFIMPSIHETFGLVYAEAMSQGLPVIYTFGQGFDGQFEEGTAGYHVNPNNSEDIAEKVLFIINNYNTISTRCSKLSQRFNWKSIAEEYNHLYRDILS